MKLVLRFAALTLALVTLASASVPVPSGIPMPECGLCDGSGN